MDNNKIRRDLSGVNTSKPTRQKLAGRTRGIKAPTQPTPYKPKPVQASQLPMWDGEFMAQPPASCAELSAHPVGNFPTGYDNPWKICCNLPSSSSNICLSEWQCTGTNGVGGSITSDSNCSSHLQQPWCECQTDSECDDYSAGYNCDLGGWYGSQYTGGDAPDCVIMGTGQGSMRGCCGGVCTHFAGGGGAVIDECEDDCQFLQFRGADNVWRVLSSYQNVYGDNYLNSDGGPDINTLSDEETCGFNFNNGFGLGGVNDIRAKCSSGVYRTICDQDEGYTGCNWPNDFPGQHPSGCAICGDAYGEDIDLWGYTFNTVSTKYIYLYDQGLTGPIPSEIGQFTNLETLNLAKNSLTGPIPADLLGNLTNLTLLDLRKNNFGGPISLGEDTLPGLEHLDLSDNNLTGEIPSGLGEMANLGVLKLDHNQLTGQIPSSIGNLTNLNTLYLQSNQLSDHLPSNLTPWVGMNISLAFNNLTGDIPYEWCEWIMDTGGFGIDGDWYYISDGNNFCNTCGNNFPSTFTDGLDACGVCNGDGSSCDGIDAYSCPPQSPYDGWGELWDCLGWCDCTPYCPAVNNSPVSAGGGVEACVGSSMGVWYWYSDSDSCDADAEAWCASHYYTNTNGDVVACNCRNMGDDG